MAGILRNLSLLMTIGTIQAEDFGVRGATYPVIEESLLEHIQKQLTALPEATLLMKQLEVQGRIKHTIQMPAPVDHIRTATRNRTYVYDPTISLDNDIKDHDGRIVAAKGTTSNPLDSLQIQSSLLIFDGTNPDQVAWAKKQGSDTKWILIKGHPFELMQREDRIVYFDQGGAICRQLKIRAVPAKVRQEGMILRIDEGFSNRSHNACSR